MLTIRRLLTQRTMKVDDPSTPRSPPCESQVSEHRHAADSDPVSDVFLTAWRRFDSIYPGGESLPWLPGVPKNVVRNINWSGRRPVRLSAKLHARVTIRRCSCDHQGG